MIGIEQSKAEMITCHSHAIQSQFSHANRIFNAEVPSWRQGRDQSAVPPCVHCLREELHYRLKPEMYLDFVIDLSIIFEISKILNSRQEPDISPNFNTSQGSPV